VNVMPTQLAMRHPPRRATTAGASQVLHAPAPPPTLPPKCGVPRSCPCVTGQHAREAMPASRSCLTLLQCGMKSAPNRLLYTIMNTPIRPPGAMVAKGAVPSIVTDGCFASFWCHVHQCPPPKVTRCLNWVEFRKCSYNKTSAWPYIAAAPHKRPAASVLRGHLPHTRPACLKM
jgi:hypothetical protein